MNVYDIVELFTNMQEVSLHPLVSKRRAGRRTWLNILVDVVYVGALNSIAMRAE